MKSAEIKALYAELKEEIEERLGDFRMICEEGRERDAYAELVFCLLTPQSKAKVCWKAVECMKWDIMLSGSEQEITECLAGVRFKYTKAKRVVAARRFLIDGEPALLYFIRGFETPEDAREWLVRNVDGYGMKEASHFLRNIGIGENLAILDRHILRNLVDAGVIEEIPKSLTERRYIEIEEKMRSLSGEIEIPMAALDLLFWYDGAGEIFK